MHLLYKIYSSGITLYNFDNYRNLNLNTFVFMGIRFDYNYIKLICKSEMTEIYRSEMMEICRSEMMKMYRSEMKMCSREMEIYRNEIT